MTNIKDYENTVTERLYDLMANINPCESCKFRGGTTDKCGSCCFWYASEFVMGDESEAEKLTSDKDTLQAKAEAALEKRMGTYGYIRKDNCYKPYTDGYRDGAKENSPVWHEIFLGSRPNPCEYWDLPQDNLPKKEDFYFVKLKNGYIKICELKYDHWSRKKHFYDLHGGKQSNVAEWLDYPTSEEDK